MKDSHGHDKEFKGSIFEDTHAVEIPTEGWSSKEHMNKSFRER